MFSFGTKLVLNSILSSGKVSSSSGRSSSSSSWWRRTILLNYASRLSTDTVWAKVGGSIVASGVHGAHLIVRIVAVPDTFEAKLDANGLEIY